MRWRHMGTGRGTERTGSGGYGGFGGHSFLVRAAANGSGRGVSSVIVRNPPAETDTSCNGL